MRGQVVILTVGLRIISSDGLKLELRQGNQKAICFQTFLFANRQT
jgi:hypothetical protein